jgi:DNA-binding transcriptional MerR regulator
MAAHAGMSLEEIDAELAKLRELRQAFKKSTKVNQRKIATLERRKNRLVAQVQEIDKQIENLRHETNLEPAPVTHRRGRRPKSALLAVGQ